MFQKHQEPDKIDIKEEELNKNNEINKKGTSHEPHKETKYDHQETIKELHNEIEKLKKEVGEKNKLSDDNMELAKRIKAEFENYKKRVLKEYEENIKLSNEEIIKDLLPVLVHFEKALKINNIQDEKFKSFFKGVELIEKEFKKVLSSYGLKELNPSPGEVFDPNFQEAILLEENEKFKEGTIIETSEIGYQISNKLIKPAKVKVAKASKKADKTELEKTGKS